MSWCPALLFDGDRSLPAICSIDYRLRVKEEGSAETSRWRDCAEFPLASPSPPSAVRSVTGAVCDPAYGRTRACTVTNLPNVLDYSTLICYPIYTYQALFPRCLNLHLIGIPAAGAC